MDVHSSNSAVQSAVATSFAGDSGIPSANAFHSTPLSSNENTQGSVNGRRAPLYKNIGTGEAPLPWSAATGTSTSWTAQ